MDDTESRSGKEPLYHNNGSDKHYHKLSYAQITQTNTHYYNSDFNTEHNYSDEWADIVIENIEKNELPDFDITNCDLEKIWTALETPEGTIEFIKYKLQTKPTNLVIPPAISLKFKHLNTTFFTTFTRNKNTLPAYQKEFQDLQSTAINNYKFKNNLTLTTREIRHTISQILKAYLIIQFLLNTNLKHLNHFNTYKLIYYCKSFMQLQKLELATIK